MPRIKSRRASQGDGGFFVGDIKKTRWFGSSHCLQSVKLRAAKHPCQSRHADFASGRYIELLSGSDCDCKQADYLAPLYFAAQQIQHPNLALFCWRLSRCQRGNRGIFLSH
jgi:hypothetical protein